MAPEARLGKKARYNVGKGEGLDSTRLDHTNNIIIPKWGIVVEIPRS